MWRSVVWLVSRWRFFSALHYQLFRSRGVVAQDLVAAICDNTALGTCAEMMIPRDGFPTNLNAQIDAFLQRLKIVFAKLLTSGYSAGGVPLRFKLTRHLPSGIMREKRRLRHLALRCLLTGLKRAKQIRVYPLIRRLKRNSDRPQRSEA